MISGAMSEKQQRRIRWAWISALPVSAVILIGLYFNLQKPVHTGRDLGWPMYLIVGWIPIGMVVLAIRARFGMITQFEYDDATLRYRTIDRPAWASRAIAELDQITEWRNSRDKIGYYLVFRGGIKLTLSLQIEGAQELADRLRRDRWPDSA
jgi:hypothetical protein